MELLGKGGLLEALEICLRYSDWCNAVPFKWNETSYQMEMKNKRKQYIFSCQLGIALLFLILDTIQICLVLETASLMVITHSMLFLAAGVFILSGLLVNCLQLSGFVQLCNGFIRLEQTFLKDFEINNNKRRGSPTNLSLRTIIYLVTSTGIMIPIVFSLDILRNPCFPAYAGYWMSRQCEHDKPGCYLAPTWNVGEVLTKILISLAVYFVWAPLLAGCAFQTALEYVVEGHCLRVGIAEFGIRILRVPMNNYRELRKLVLFHRQLQVLSIHYRLNVSQILACAIPCHIAMQISCLYNTIAFISGKDTGGPVWYTLAFVWAQVDVVVVTIFVFGMLADVNTISTRAQNNINGRPELKRNKWFKRWIKSCPVFRIYFGGSNYLDRLTPLNIQNFAITQTVSLMLLNR